MLQKLLDYVNDGVDEIVISFVPATKKLKAKYLKCGDDELAGVRGNVEVKYLIDRDFGIPNWRVYHIEKNVSFDKFENEVVIPLLKCNLKVGNFNEVFPSF